MPKTAVFPLRRLGALSPAGATGCMLLCGVLWSFGGLFVKLLPWHPVVISGARGLIACLSLLAFCKAAKIPVRLTGRGVLGGAFLCATLLSYVLATKLTTAANAIVLQYTSPVFVMLLCALIYRQRPRGADVLVVLVTLSGIALFFLEQLTPGGLAGNLVGILSGVANASFYVYCANACKEESGPFGVIILGQGMTFLVSLPFWFLAPPVLGAAQIGSILFLGLVQQTLPYILYAYAIRRCPALTASLVSVAEPLLNPLWVLLAVGERPGTLSLIGAGVVLLAVTAWCLNNQRLGAKV